MLLCGDFNPQRAGRGIGNNIHTEGRREGENRKTDEHACTHTKLQDVQTRLERGGGGGTEGEQKEGEIL